MQTSRLGSIIGVGATLILPATTIHWNSLIIIVLILLFPLQREKLSWLVTAQVMMTKGCIIARKKENKAYYCYLQDTWALDTISVWGGWLNG